MLPISTLFDLIKTLNKSEKRYFRVAVGDREPKSYLELYHILCEWTVLGKEELRRLRAKFGHHQLEIARKHLSRVLLSALSRYHASEDAEALLWERYTGARLMYRKGFYDAAARLAEQGMDASEKTANTHFFALFSYLHLEIGASQKFVGWDEEALVKAHAVLRQNEEVEETRRMHASLYEILLYRYWRNGTVRSQLQKAQLNDIMLEEHQILRNYSRESFRSTQLHLHFQSIYFRMTGDWEGSLRVFYALDELFQKHPGEWKGSPGDYIQFLQDVLLTLRSFEAFDEMQYFLTRLKSIPASSQAEKSRMEFMLAEHDLHIALAMGSADYPRVIPVFNDRLQWHDQIQWKFTLARFHYFRKDYPAALQLVNELLLSPETALGKQNYSKIRILLLMIHQAMDNRDYLFYELRSFERKMKKGEDWHTTEELVTDYFRHWLSFRPMDRLYDRLTQVLENPYERVMVSELGLKQWFKMD